MMQKKMEGKLEKKIIQFNTNIFNPSMHYKSQKREEC